MQKYGRNEHRHRINDQIRITPVRVVKDESQLGVMPTTTALDMARREGLDLVEISPKSRPPVCYIMDYGRYRYEQSLREKEAQKKQRAVQDKIIRLTPTVDVHDLETKINQAKGFLEDGKKVVFNLVFKGRLIVHKDLGHKVMGKVLEDLKDQVIVEFPPKMEGKTIVCRVAPKKDKDK